ncbi:MAG: alpha/beta hydrolase [Gammaproteobacteria bacterium]
MNHQPSRFLLLLAISLLPAACAAPHFQSVAANPSTPTLYEDHALMDDGYRLPVAQWRPVGAPQAVVLALHGFNDYHHAFAGIGEALVARGVMTYAYDQRGFGATAERGIWPGTERLVADARAMVRLLRRTHPGIPFYLMGESMGGAVAMVLLGQGTAPPVDGAVLIAPAVWARNTMPTLQRLALWLGVRIMPAKTLSGEGLKIRASDNEDMLRRLWEDPLVIRASRIDTLYGLSKLMDRALAAAPRLTARTLILYGMHDQIIPKVPTCRMLTTLPADSRWRFALYPQGYHMLTRDLGGALVLRDISAWLEDQQAALPSKAEVLRPRLAALHNPHCKALWKKAVPPMPTH